MNPLSAVNAPPTTKVKDFDITLKNLPNDASCGKNCEAKKTYC